MPKDRREAILDAFERSGMSGQAFATHIGVKYTTFATWVQKRRRTRGDYKPEESRGAVPIKLLEAVFEPEVPAKRSGTIEVETVQGIKLRIGSSAEVALAVELLQAIGGARGC